MEYQNEYASKSTTGIATAGLVTGIVGALGALNGGGLGNIFGMGQNGCAEDHFVNRYEAQQNARIAELETEVKLRDSNIYTDGKILELYKYVDGKFAVVEHELCDQRTYNAVNTATIGCIRSDVAELMALTKRVVSNGSICPGWGDVTVSVTPAPTTTG
ncbi:MAG: hypothetical protein IKU42_05895 [Oscillospiraceae bacterium]|nr:hypothetical protein [Oscillospiraceae bacterium]